MFKNISIAPLIPILLLFTLLHAAIGQEPNVVDEAQKQVKSFWANAQVYVGVSVIIFLFTSISYIIRLFKKDKLLKKLLNKYVVFQMKDGRRYRGTMRLEFTGMEIISEESRQRGHAPSYIFTNPERDEGIVAYIRYHDAMNERELRERVWELERVYHPPLLFRIGRKIRNMFIALRDAVDQTISMVWSSIKRSADSRLGRYRTAFQEMQDDNDAELTQRFDTIEKQSAEFLEQESYERLIERLVGTRVKVQTATGEYTAILKDYNDKHIALMNVKDDDNNGYKDEWEYEHEFDHNLARLNYRDDRGLRCRAEGDDANGYQIVFENNTPYPIQLGRIILWEDAPKWEKDYKYKYHIGAFSVQKLPIRPYATHRIEPFEKVASRVAINLKQYKKIKFKFRSFRDADIVFPRRYCNIVESAEKYQPELFSLTGLTDTILDLRDSEDIAITDKEGEPVHGINVVHGYVTNINEERIDLKAIDTSYGRRWDVENAFGRFENKLRRGLPVHKRFLPFTRTKIAAHALLIEQIHDNPTQHAALAPIVYPKVLNSRSRKLASHALRHLPSSMNLPRALSRVGWPHSQTRHALPLKVMALTGNTTTVEFPILKRFEYIQEHHMIYNAVQDLRTDKLAKTHILWIGNGEIYKFGYRLNIDTEHRIKNFVSQGGIVIVSGQDVKTNYKQRRGTGWIPEPLTGIECEETEALLPTSQGKRTRIFQYPNVLNGNHADPDAKDVPSIRLDDMWLDPLGKWTSLAKTNRMDAHLPGTSSQEASALLLLPFQKGLYIVTSLKNETEEDVQINDKIMENLLHFSVNWLDRQKPFGHPLR